MYTHTMYNMFGKDKSARKTNPLNLIKSVEKQPSIWDSVCPEYKDKKIKEEAWNKVASEVVDGWSEYNRSEKYLILRTITRRWNNIRDYYYKLSKAHLKGELSERSYIFADKLKFLRPELRRNLTERGRTKYEDIVLESSSTGMKNEQQTEPETEEDGGDTVTFVDLENCLSDTNQSTECVDTEPLIFDAVMNESAKYHHEEDADLMFLKSLLPDMKKLEDDDKFAFKFAIMQAYMNIINKKKSSSVGESSRSTNCPTD